MLNSIIRISLQNRSLVIALSLILLGIGGYVATSMPVDDFPDLTAPTITVITEAHGMARSRSRPSSRSRSRRQ